jgi:hypothetical protein
MQRFLRRFRSRKERKIFNAASLKPGLSLGAARKGCVRHAGCYDSIEMSKNPGQKMIKFTAGRA